MLHNIQAYCLICNLNIYIMTHHNLGISITTRVLKFNLFFNFYNSNTLVYVGILIFQPIDIICLACIQCNYDQ